MRKLLLALTNTVLVLGSIGGAIVMFFIYGLCGVFILWMVKWFGGAMIETDWITSEYLIKPFSFIFVDNFEITQIAFVLIFGLLGAINFLIPDNSNQ